MNLQDLANISQILQAFLVVISLGFIWYQLREGVRLAKSDSARSLLEQAQAFNSLLIQNGDLAEIWYSYGRNFQPDNQINQLRYQEMLLQWLIFHEYIYYQWKQKLLDDEMYSLWLADLERSIQKHNLDLLPEGLENTFFGSFGRHLNQIQAKINRQIV